MLEAVDISTFFNSSTDITESVQCCEHVVVSPTVSKPGKIVIKQLIT